MDQEKRIKALSKELVGVRAKMEELGPIVLGTMVENGKKWRALNRRWVLLTSRLAVLGALKKTARDAGAEVRHASGDSDGRKRHGVRRGRRGRGGAP